ncbi:MAG: AMP-binding protein [Myxococcales bacterium]|nr:AMP-binding protein [Myxococcales bacterium]
MHQNGLSNGAGVAPPLPPLAPLDVEAQLGGSRLLVLGGTGFLGKIFWIMLLHHYPSIGKIFLLVRSSKKATSTERFWAEIATSEALLPMRERHGDGLEAFLREKIEPIDGDVGNPHCGIDPAFLREHKGTIDAVVNVAGVVDFNPPLDEALDTNAFGAKNLVDLCRALDAPLFHTSTCYVVGNRKGLIQEDVPGEVYPFPRADELGRELWDPDREIKDCLDIVAQAKSRCDDAFRQSEFLERATKNLLRRGEPTSGPALDQELKSVRRQWVSARLVDAGVERATHWGWPNVYTYTKSIGEQIIARSGLRYTIARPACCETTLEFPFPAWNEGMGTSAPIVFLIMKGHHQVVARDVVLDFIPSDTVCAGMILTLAELLEGTQKAVYQYGTSDVNPSTSARFGELMGLYRRKHYQRTGKGNPFKNFLMAHYEPAIVDIERFDSAGPGQIASAARVLAKMLKSAPGPAARITKPAARSLEKVASQEEKIDMIIRLFLPFTYDQKGPFSCANTRHAYARLGASDRAKLKWRPETLDWADYFMNQHMPAMEKRIIPWMDDRYKKELKPLKPHETLVTLVDQMAERHEHAVALGRFEDPGFTRITFADVKRRADDVAARLAARGVVKGDRIVLAGKNCPAWSIAYFGVMRAGAVCVPMDPDLDAPSFVNVARESGAKLAILDAHVEKRTGAALTAGLAALERVLLEPTAADADPAEGLVPPVVSVREEDVASLIFTSGTTGHPKGVRLSHGNFASLIAALAPLFPLGIHDRVLSVLPLHHTFEFTAGLLLPFSRGTRILYPGELTGDRLTAALKEGRITGMVGVPAVWQLLERRILARVKDEGAVVETLFHAGGDLSRWLSKNAGIDVGRALFGAVHEELGGHVKWLISGGAALPKDTQKLFTGLGLLLTEGYGLTEASPVLAVAKAGSPAGQVGKAIPGVELRIDAPDAEGVGEVLAKGPNVMLGYTDDDATRDAIDAAGWLHTGDLGKFDKRGRLQIVGRAKDVVVTSSGENLYPDDLERLLGVVPHIEELAFVGVDNPSGGERLACIAVPKTDDTITRQERITRADRALRDAIAKLPHGKQPQVIHLYDAPLPRTATRKVKRTEVRQILGRTIAATQRSREDGPATPVRSALAGLKGMKSSDISGDMTIAGDLALDSLALTELLVALEAKVGIIEPQALQACRTVADVEELIGAERPSLRPARAETSSRYRIEGRAKPTAGDGDDAAFTLPPELQTAGKRLIGKLQDAFYGQVMSPRVSGRAFIPHNRNVLVVANHASHLDMGFVRHALGKYGEDVVTLAAQDYFFEKGSVKRAFFENLTNLKAIDRKSGLRASERQAGEVLSRGKTVLIFPEGTRSPDGDVHEFKSFLGHLVLTYNVDVLPIFVGGTRDAMGKGAKLPTKREIFARIGPALTVKDLRRLTHGMSYGDASREVAKLARAAVLALRGEDVLDLSRLETLSEQKKQEHPLVTLFAELETKFRPDRVERPVSFYFTLGGEDAAKWTVRVAGPQGATCEIKQGKPEGGTADCVLKTSPEIFTKIVNGYTPSPAEFISGAIKSNDVSLLMEFQKVFALA